MDQYFVYSNSKFYPSPLDFRSHSALPKTGYASVYSVDLATAEALSTEGTVQGFKGVVWSERVWLDFDEERPFVEARKRLKELGLSHVVYTTGNRGGHVGVARDATPSHLLPARDKAWATTQFPGCDPSLYSHLHLFRLPGTVHEKTGHKKHQIDAVNGATLQLPPRQDLDLNLGGANQVLRHEVPISLFEMRTIMANSVPVSGRGGRHEQLVRLSYALKNNGVSSENAFFWIKEVNKMFEEPKSDGELSHLIQSIFR